MDAAGNSSISIHYKTFDNRPIYPITYYRLFQKDLNGSAELSDITSVIIEDQNLFNLFPNPSSKLVNISLQNRTVDILIFNEIGQLVEDFYDISGNTFTLDASFYSKGIYIVQINEKEAPIFRKLVIQ